MKSLQNTTDAVFGLKMSKEAQSLLSQIDSLQKSMHGGTVTITTVEQMELGSKEAFNILARATSNDYQKILVPMLLIFLKKLIRYLENLIE